MGLLVQNRLNLRRFILLLKKAGVNGLPGGLTDIIGDQPAPLLQPYDIQPDRIFDCRDLNIAAPNAMLVIFSLLENLVPRAERVEQHLDVHSVSGALPG